jgi:hypothetical protein
MLDIMRLAGTALALAGGALIPAIVAPGFSGQADAASRVYINTQSYGLPPHASYRPRTLKRITGDGTAYLTNIAWRGWNSALATASARIHRDDCNPSCAEGSYYTQTVRLHAYRRRLCPVAGKLVYTRLRIIERPGDPKVRIGGAAVLNLYHDCEPSPEQPGTAATCDPSYEGACLDADASDYDCAGGTGDGPGYVQGPITVVGDDHYGLDSDGDGIACEG